MKILEIFQYTFVKKSSDVFEYTFDLRDKINSSYTNFMVIAKDLKTGYASNYMAQTCDYKGKKDNNNKKPINFNNLKYK